jgi:glyoxylase-like metal-dependent hydrolase (beta-lactamase superfamily II)/rhodanese-related sulfurtransferase
MQVESFRTPGLGDQTYLFIHDGVGVLVDPQRDVDRFLRVAADRGVAVQYVLETHLHNDYVSGGVEAARRTGAELILPAAAAPAYDHRPAFHHEPITGDGYDIRPIHTPGHTPEHTSYVIVIDGAPVAVFSGGSLLVASAGRPDLLGWARARSLGKLQYTSVRRLAELPADVALYPTHGAGSFCTASGAGQYTSTIGDERHTNPVLQVDGPDAMADLLLARPMPIPAFYRHMGPANTLGVPDMRGTAVPDMSVAALELLPSDTQVIDIRPRTVQAEGVLPGSLAIELTDDFGSWAAWLSPHGAPVVLVARDDDDVAAAVTQLAQVGVDDVRGVIRDLTGARTVGFSVLDLPAFVDGLATDAQILDVRMPSEYEDEPLPGAHERFLPELLTEGLPAGIDPSRPVHVVCATGRRAAIAASVLANQGVAAVVLTDAGARELATIDARAA